MANTKGVKKHKKAAKPKPPESLGPEPESLSWLDLEPFEFDLEPFEWPDLGALSWPDLGTFELKIPYPQTADTLSGAELARSGNF